MCGSLLGGISLCSASAHHRTVKLDLSGRYARREPSARRGANPKSAGRALGADAKKKKEWFRNSENTPASDRRNLDGAKRRSLTGIRGTEFIGRTMPAAQEAKMERIRLTRFYERTSKNGQVYLSGNLGYGGRALIFGAGETEDGTRMFDLFLVPKAEPESLQKSAPASRTIEVESEPRTTAKPKRRRKTAKPKPAPSGNDPDDPISDLWQGPDGTDSNGDPTIKGQPWLA